MTVSIETTGDEGEVKGATSYVAVCFLSTFLWFLFLSGVILYFCL